MYVCEHAEVHLRSTSRESVSSVHPSGLAVLLPRILGTLKITACLNVKLMFYVVGSLGEYKRESP